MSAAVRQNMQSALLASHPGGPVAAKPGAGHEGVCEGLQLANHVRCVLKSRHNIGTKLTFLSQKGVQSPAARSTSDERRYWRTGAERGENRRRNQVQEAAITVAIAIGSPSGKS